MAWGEVTWPTPPPPSPMNQRDREEEREERPHTLAPSPKTNIIHILHQKDPMTRLHYNKIFVGKKEETGFRLALALEVGGKWVITEMAESLPGYIYKMGDGRDDRLGVVTERQRVFWAPSLWVGVGWVVHGLDRESTQNLNPPRPPPLSFSPHLPQPTEYVWIGCVRQVLFVVNEYSLNLLLLHSFSQDNDKNNYFCPYNLSIPNNNKGLLF